MSAPTPAEKPTHARYKAIAFGVALSFITYLDRVAISQAAPAISAEMRLQRNSDGPLFSGVRSDLRAARNPQRMAVRPHRTAQGADAPLAVLWWSFFTAATGWAWNLPSLIATRLLFGAGEAGCFPGLAKSFRTWLPPSERPMAEGIKATAARWAAACTPFLLVTLYRVCFLARRVLDLRRNRSRLGGCFHWWHRDDPAGHHRGRIQPSRLRRAQRRAKNRGSLGPTPWRAAAPIAARWALCVQWFCHY